MKTSCPRCVSSRTPAGVRATRYSSGFISVGTPTFIGGYRKPIATYDLIADLPLVVDAYDLEGREMDVSSDFTRLTTTIHLRGGGHDGEGEDVTYDALDHVALQDAGANLPLAGEWTLRSFREHIDTLELWPGEPVRDVSKLYRRWAYESAALDLALRQAGRSPRSWTASRDPSTSSCRCGCTAIRRTRSACARSSRSTQRRASSSTRRRPGARSSSPSCATSAWSTRST